MLIFIDEVFPFLLSVLLIGSHLPFKILVFGPDLFQLNSVSSMISL